ncbi:hypothetical protein OSB04_010815 [Centaurea solstitialis]|uniref:CCHC-type domain-containing protein n=1 Tax=Centaurea solstitialis TaxID=347529 RepID=A0AA38TLG2_9ASTR|nr:hypothetical protein OSB04_010815 [Centaurea solstitialis]
MFVLACKFFFVYTVVNANNVSAQLAGIPTLNGTNYAIWKESVEIVLGCMDLDHALRMERLISTTENPNTDKIEKWDRSNRMCLMIMKRSIPSTFRGSITEGTNAKNFLKEIEQFFAKNAKTEASNTLMKLVTMRYKEKGNIREYIMEMSNLNGKLKELKLELSDDLLVHLILISLPAQFGPFVVSYNTQKDKWTLNELMSHLVQEEERLKRDKTESAHLASTSQDKKKKRAKGTAENVPKQKKHKKQDKEFTCFFCKKAGHIKKECPKYKRNEPVYNSSENCFFGYKRSYNLVGSSGLGIQFLFRCACFVFTCNSQQWLQNFVTGLRIVKGVERPLKLFCDNNSAVLYSNNNRSSIKSKHIDIKFLVVKERVQNGQIMIEHIGTNSMLADPLTKALVPKIFHEHTKNMGVFLDDTTF